MRNKTCKMTTKEIHPKYRPDIDGLRALAILPVILFHAFPQFLTGGFIGVDIFFVISGYLISTIIFKEQDRGIFSFRHFYARRVNRIFPAFLLVLFVTLIAGWAILFPKEIENLGKHGFNAGLFVLNIVLFQEKGYFETASEMKPLLHFWSLCVEEQYYLIWPVIIALFWKFKNARLYILGLLAVFSFGLNIYYTFNKPDLAFYFSIPRFWELLAGSCLAWWVIYKGNSLPLYVQNIFSVAGFTGIVIAMMLLDETKAFPGFWAVLPVLGSVLLIASPKAFLNKKILSAKVPVFIGLISYPLYLWHWPLLVFPKIWLGWYVLNPLLASGLVMLAFLLALGTYFWLEKPLRKLPSGRKTTMLVFLSIGMIILSLMLYKQIIPSRLALDKRSVDILAAKNDWHYPMKANHTRMDGFESLTLNSGRDRTVAIIGDSHAEQYWARFEKLVKDNPESKPTIRFITSAGCLPLPGVNRAERGFGCHNLYRFILDQVSQPEVTTIMLTAYWENYFDQAYLVPEGFPLITISDNQKPVLGSTQMEKIMQDFIHDLKQLKSQGKKIYLVLSNPTSPQYDPLGMVSRKGEMIIPPPLDKEAFLEATQKMRKQLYDAAQKSGAIIIDPVEFLCKNNSCPVVMNDRPIYIDHDHFRDSFSREHAGFVDQVIK